MVSKSNKVNDQQPYLTADKAHKIIYEVHQSRFQMQNPLRFTTRELIQDSV